MASIYGPDTTEAVRTELVKLAGTVTEKEFSTGSTGFYGRAELHIGGRRFLVQIQAVEAGSKR
jgi:hypothetical protein